MLKTKEINSQGIAHNALSKGSSIKGEINADGDFRIDGRIEGSVNGLGKIVVGPQAEIIGTITCDNLEIMGRVKGNIRVKSNVSLRHSCIYVGDMVTQTLEIEPGAIFNGSCRMMKEEKSES
ncbi:MAG: polymer-forming cytoskeletal protein [Dysgonamonadaceae bacterium]|jgi:cytoskeletal protein CcmA (bactofilin family)|nr:polymer-forming cytoskeletal protein [Dysgonamonadaceae bacterium]